MTILVSSFWQASKRKLQRFHSLYVQGGKVYRYRVTAFGLSSSLASLTRGFDFALEPEVNRNTIIYVDHCLCFSDNMEMHLHHLHLLSSNVRNQNIMVKSQFSQKEILYLKFKLTTEDIQATMEKVTVIQNFPRPRNQKQLKAFLRHKFLQ